MKTIRKKFRKKENNMSFWKTIVNFFNKADESEKILDEAISMKLGLAAKPLPKNFTLKKVNFHVTKGKRENSAISHVYS